METSISKFHKDCYIPEIQKLALYLPHVRILGTRHCGNPLVEACKCRSSYQDIFYCIDYAEHVVDSFAHRIQ